MIAMAGGWWLRCRNGLQLAQLNYECASRLLGGAAACARLRLGSSACITRTLLQHSILCHVLANPRSNDLWPETTAAAPVPPCPISQQVFALAARRAVLRGHGRGNMGIPAACSISCSLRVRLDYRSSMWKYIMRGGETTLARIYCPIFVARTGRGPKH